MSLPIITLEEFQSCPWCEAISGVQDKIHNKIHNYSYALMKKSEEFDAGSSQDKALKLLGVICSMVLKNDGTKPIFSPMFAFDYQNPSRLEDIPKETLGVLFHFSSAISNNILRARIMDILWVRKIDNRVQAANEDVNSYLKCANELDYDPYESIQYLQRALDIT